MADRTTSKPVELVRAMVEDALQLNGWGMPGHWRTLAAELAQFVATHHKKLKPREAAMFVQLGGLLLVMDKREREASAPSPAECQGDPA